MRTHEQREGSITHCGLLEETRGVTAEGRVVGEGQHGEKCQIELTWVMEAAKHIATYVPMQQCCMMCTCTTEPKVKLHTHTHAHRHIYMYIYVYIKMCMCVYIHVYVCVCVYINTYIYIHREREKIDNLKKYLLYRSIKILEF